MSRIQYCTAKSKSEIDLCRAPYHSILAMNDYEEARYEPNTDGENLDFHALYPGIDFQATVLNRWDVGILQDPRRKVTTLKIDSHTGDDIDCSKIPPTVRRLFIQKSPALTSLRGLQVGPSLVTLIGLEGLTSLEGLPLGMSNLVIKDCPDLTSLEGIPKNLRLQKLILTNLPGVTTLAGLPESLHNGLLDLNDLPHLTSLVGIPSGCMDTCLSNLPAVTSLTGLPSDSDFTNLTIDDLPGVTTLVGLASVSHLDMRNMPGLTSLEGLRSDLGTCTLKLTGIPGLTSLSGLPQDLKTGTLHLTDLPSLTSLAGIPDSLRACPIELTDLPRLSSLAEIPAHLRVKDLKLTNLPGLTSMDAECNAARITMNQCPAISIFASASPSVRNLVVRDCPGIKALPFGLTLKELAMDFPRRVHWPHSLEVIPANTEYLDDGTEVTRSGRVQTAKEYNSLVERASDHVYSRKKGVRR